MTLILLATTATGSIASFMLLHLGVAHFGYRYALSVLAAYAALLGLIGLWSRYEGRRLCGGQAENGGGSNAADFVDGGMNVSVSPGGSSGGSSAARLGSGGGRFGGAGASGAYEDDAPTPAVASMPSSKGGSGLSIDLDGDEIVVVILIVVAVSAAVLAAGYIIWIAPNFLGDVLAASLAGAGLSRRVAKHDSGWMGLVVKRTALPAAAMLIAFSAAGFALQSYAPGARTLHGAWLVHLARHSEQ